MTSRKPTDLLQKKKERDKRSNHCFLCFTVVTPAVVVRSAPYRHALTQSTCTHLFNPPHPTIHPPLDPSSPNKKKRRTNKNRIAMYLNNNWDQGREGRRFVPPVIFTYFYLSFPPFMHLVFCISLSLSLSLSPLFFLSALHFPHVFARALLSTRCPNPPQPRVRRRRHPNTVIPLNFLPPPPQPPSYRPAPALVLVFFFFSKIGCLFRATPHLPHTPRASALG